MSVDRSTGRPGPEAGPGLSAFWVPTILAPAALLLLPRTGRKLERAAAMWA